MPPKLHFPLKRRRRIVHHTVQHWYGLHSLILPFIMGNKSLAQIDSTSAILWDAARAVGVGLVFVWMATPTPIQVLTIVMALNLIVIIRAHWQHTPGMQHTVGEEIWRMLFTLFLLATFRVLVRLTNSSTIPILFAAGVLGWWEAVLMTRCILLMGYKLPPIVEQFTMAMFRLNSKKLARWARLGEEEKPEERAEPPE